MTQELWTKVDRYIDDILVHGDSLLDDVLESIVAAGFRQISVSPPQGKLLNLLARIQGARRILEIGTLGGYSTIWLARALPLDGKLITLEIDPKCAEIARANFERAGLANIVELRLGKAVDTLSQLVAEGCEPFDLVFIDADMESSADYFIWVLKLCRRGSQIIVDNVIRSGAVTDPANTDTRILGVRRLNDTIAAEPRVSATEIQTVGSKGYDGFALAIVIADR